MVGLLVGLYATGFPTVPGRPVLFIRKLFEPGLFVYSVVFPEFGLAENLRLAEGDQNCFRPVNLFAGTSPGVSGSTVCDLERVAGGSRV